MDQKDNTECNQWYKMTDRYSSFYNLEKKYFLKNEFNSIRRSTESIILSSQTPTGNIHYSEGSAEQVK